MASHVNWHKLSDAQKERYRERFRKNAAKYRENNRTILHAIKEERGCAKCGDKRWWVLCFHHRDPAQKKFKIGDNIHGGNYFSRQKMIEEVAKCDVLCHNCHADLHYREVSSELE